MTLRSFVFLLALVAASAADEKPIYQGLKWRSIGPYRGGRVIAVTGVPSQRGTFYFGATGGGVWKTTDAGQTWLNISDGFFKTGTVGAIAVSESNPNVIYAGMGESCVRGNVSHGDGIYRSSDGGKTWRHMGLAATRHVGRVRVHPRNADLVYVAALGHIFGPNEERGVYRSKDGGKAWEKVLFKSRDTGAVDLAMDPNNPDVLYAALWQARRTPWGFDSGGPEGGLWKSVDGGDTWTEITRNEGLPKGLVGRIGVSVSPVNSDRVWAVIEAEDGGVFRSDDAGKTWRRTNENRNLRQRAWYYTHVHADTQDADRVYVLNVGLWRSDDAGRTFRQIPSPHGDDHDLWISPHDNKTMIIGDDGGASVSASGGNTWTQQTQATAQFYRVALDNDFPYNIYGAQQDNSTVRIASRTTSFGITDRHWWPVGGGESGWIAPHPNDSNIVFAGSYGGYLTRYDHRTGQTRAVNVWPDNPMGYGAEGMKYRFQWNFPILFSPHDSNTLYTAGNILFKTNNEGQTWQAISGDLTRHDPAKLGPSGGPITKDNTGVEYYSTIFTVAESPKRKGVIWAGSDDGLVHVTQDGGKTWTNVTPKEMPEWIQINSIEASPHDPAAAYFAGTMYKSDDFWPYLYKTSDYGKTWTKITNGLPADSFTRVIREDPARRGMLYAGTETGLWVSFDDGASWEPLQMNLPAVPITDLAVHTREKDLVAATQGRSFWILDDLTVLHEYKDKRDAVKAGAYLFAPEPAYRMAGGRFRAQAGGTVGENPPVGVVLSYTLPEKPKGEVTIEILDPGGKPIRKYTSKQEPRAGGGEAPETGGEGGPRGAGRAAAVPAEKGLNQFVWDLRYPDAVSFPGLIMWAGSTRGPLAVPGNYRARLSLDGKTLETGFEIRKDPRLTTTQQDFEKQLTLLLQIREKLSETHEAIIQIRDLRRQVNDLADRYKDLPDGKTIGDAAKELAKKLSAVEEELYQTKLQSSQDPLNYPIKLNNKLAALAGIVASADTAPTDQSYQLHEELTSRINAQLRVLQGLVEKDVAGFNKLIRDKNVPAVAPKKPTPRS